MDHVISCLTPCIGPVCTVLLGTVSPKFMNMLNLKDNMEEFLRRKDALKARIETVQNSADSERRNRMKVTEDVEFWLGNCTKTEKECTELQNQFPMYETRINYCSCTTYKFCQDVARMMNEIEKHISQTPKYKLRSVEQPPPNVQPVNTDYIDGLHSIEKNKKAVFEALDDENVNVIGLWGMGGIGKTTLMYKINNELERRTNFKLVIIVTVSSKIKISDIQDEIESRLPKMISDDSTKRQLDAARAYKLSERLKEQGNILIIFDDVWEPLDFCKIGIPENKLCKILLTTRYRTVCARMGAREIKMEALSPDESWNLFESICFGVNDIVEVDIKDIAKKVCKECAGLPLAISVVANSLKNETSTPAWHNALKFLKEANPSRASRVSNLERDVYNPIKLSYDRLRDDDLKDCFLICSLFPEDHEINLFDLICYGIGEGKQWAMSNKGIDSLYVFLDSFKQLKSRGLLLDIGVSSEYDAKMHDIVRDVAINIAKEKGFLIKTGRGYTDWPQLEEEKDLEGKKWISLMENSLKELADQPQNIQRVEFLSLNGNEELKNIHSDFFKGMQNLLLLDLRKTSISELTQGIWKLKKLRVLMYASPYYNNEDKMPIPITLTNLSVLCLRDSYIQEVNEEFGTLVGLRVIDFSGTSIDIIRPKVFSRLKNLEILFMQGSFCDWKAWSDEEEGDCVAFVELATLKHLYALHLDIEDEEIISDKYTFVECFPSVQHFSFRCNSSRFITKHHEGFVGNILEMRQNTQNIAKWLKILLEKTNQLKLTDVECRNSVDALIEAGIGMHNLQTLMVWGASNYKNVIKYSSNVESDERRILPNLKEISIHESDGLDTIIVTPSLLPHGSFRCLVEIVIDNCNGMRFAFTWSMAQCLVQLRELRIDYCAELKYIIGNDGYNNFPCLAASQGLFSKLETLHLFYLPKLESVWQQEGSQENMQVQWPSMKGLYVGDCMNLKPFVFGKQSAPSIGNSVDALIEASVGMHNLQTLMVWGASNYKNVIKYSSNVESDERRILPNLKEISIHDSDGLDTIIVTPSLLPHGSFRCLVEIVIGNCNGMRFAFTWSMAQCLVQLRELRIYDCAELKYIIGNDGYNSFDCLAPSQGLFSKLETLNLIRSPKLESVWQQEGSQENMQVQWPSMENLQVWNCMNLKPFAFGKQSAPSIGNSVDALIEAGIGMHNLQTLTLWGASNYKNVIKYSSNVESDERRILPNLKEISIHDSDGLDTIIVTPSLLPHGSFRCLVEIVIGNCNGMRFAFTWSMAQCLVQLRELQIYFCAELKYIIGNDGYNSFDCLAPSQGLFSKLEHLILHDLPKLESVWQQDGSQENMQVQWPSMKNLKKISCAKKWFENLIWEDEETKNKFKSLFVTYDGVHRMMDERTTIVYRGCG